MPRFVSLGEDKIHVRTGPGEIYPISWIYEKKGLPVEIILEYEHWRKIRDHEGQEGWVYGPLLSGRRMGIVIGQDAVALRKKPQDGAAVLAYLNPLVITELEECANGWCRAEIQGREGWVMKKHIWGVYPDEAF